MIVHRFARCSKDVNSGLRVQYNNAFRVLMGLSRFCSVSGMFAEYRVDCFYATMRKMRISGAESTCQYRQHPEHDCGQAGLCTAATVAIQLVDDRDAAHVLPCLSLLALWLLEVWCADKPEPGTPVSPSSRPVCPPPPANCTLVAVHKNNYDFKVDGKPIQITHITELKELEIVCNDQPILESESLPSFLDPITVSTLALYKCYGPRTSYVNLLSQLNILTLASLKLTLGRKRELSSTILPPLFVELNISKLVISGAIRHPIYPDDDFFETIEGLQHIELRGISLPPLPLSNQLKSVSGTWGESSGEWGGCEHLEEIGLSHWKWKEHAAPLRWLAGCSRLQKLDLMNVDIQKILDNGFKLPSAVRTVEISRCNYKTLLIPSDFFIDASNLSHVDLTANNMSSLPSNIFTSVAATLQYLALDANPLGDLCEVNTSVLDDNGNSTGRVVLDLHLPALQRLSLLGTGAMKICANWPVILPSLTYLDLSYNSISVLQYEVIQWMGSRHSELLLKNNKVKTIMYSRSNYEHLLKDNCTQNNVTVSISERLICDCRTYWFAKSQTACPNHVLWRDTPKCTSEKRVSETPPEGMICERYGANCSAGCECFSREDVEATIANCTDSTLDRIPKIPRMSHLYAASNRINEINSTDIPDSLIFADLKYNSISHISAEAARVLFSVSERRVMFAGNLLLCDCDNRPLLDALNEHQNQVLDYNLTTCLDETPLTSVNIEDLCALPPPALLLYSLAPVVVFLIALLVTSGLCYYYRHELKVQLYARGVCMCWVREDELDRDKVFDAFVSFSHDDKQFVHQILAVELEREPYGFKLCIHSRDWVLGEWIPTQIAASVEQSRRTIIVLSRSFLSSVWGRLEFRTAHINAMQEGRARVIIILLEEVQDHEELDGELKAYLASNTYVKWGDPYFWDKLRYALPHRRGEMRARRAGEEVARDLFHIMSQTAIRNEDPGRTVVPTAALPAPQMLCIEAAPAIVAEEISN
ncbi:protein toll-like [Achroia grisella]|uniref:protein toll-like n=1 Tax=Achroia grisella TaxID=688607 RepID=UPI0027D28664|nr:protein toll-like [Achroia grisella]